ncbi:MAG: hypothetical protein ABEJ98_01170 [Candidatus Nanohaloarchaea archaeon]
MAEDYPDRVDISWSPDFEIVEDEDETLVGFTSPGEEAMFDDMYEPERWLDYLLDPGEAAEPVSDTYRTNTAAMQLVGLTLVDEMLEHDATRDTVLEYEEDVQEMTMLGYSEQLRGYASDVANKMSDLE